MAGTNTTNAVAGGRELDQEAGAPAAEEPWLLRPEEAARLLGISRSKLYELLAAGEIVSVSIGTSRRIPRDALARWIDELRC